MIQNMTVALSVPKCDSLLVNINCNFQDNIDLFIDGNNFSELNTVVDFGKAILSTYIQYCFQS